jgi:hypothetical protein
VQIMKKVKLTVENLSVQSFSTATRNDARGTVMGHDPTFHGQHCGSAYDACNTGLCTYDCPATYSPDACPTAYPEYC